MFEKKDEKQDYLKEMEKGIYPKKTVYVDGVGKFVLKYPKTTETNLISSRISDAIDGRPYDSIPGFSRVNITTDAHLSVIIDEYPEDFPEVWKKDIREYPNQEAKNVLINAFFEFREVVQRAISGKNKSK
jgi:hypothetical protein